MLRYITLLSILCYGQVSSAEESTFQIKQLLLERNRAVVEFSGNLVVGGELVATSADGRQCLLAVKVVGDKIANVDTSSCSFAQELKIGQKLESSLALAEPKQPEIPAPVATQAPVDPVSEGAASAMGLTDIQYLPSKGRSAVMLGYSITTSTASTRVKNGSQNISKSNSKANSLSVKTGYGVSDQFSVAFSIDNLINGETEFEYGPGSTLNGQTKKYKSKGWSEPEIELHYRIVEQSKQGFNVDASFGYSPKGGSEIDPTERKNGNNKRGGDAIELAGSFGQKFSVFSYAVNLSANFYGSSQSEDAETKVKTSSDAYTTVVITGHGQAKVGEKVSLRASILHGSSSDRKFTTPGSLDVTSKGYYQPAIAFEVLVDAIPGKLALSAGVARILEVDVTGQVGNTEIISTSESSVVSLSLGAQF